MPKISKLPLANKIKKEDQVPDLNDEVIKKLGETHFTTEEEHSLDTFSQDNIATVLEGNGQTLSSKTIENEAINLFQRDILVFDKDETLIHIISTDNYSDDVYKRQINKEWSFSFTTDVSLSDVIVRKNKIGVYDREGRLQLFIVEDITERYSKKPQMNVYCIHESFILNDTVLEEFTTTDSINNVLDLVLAGTTYKRGYTDRFDMAEVDMQLTSRFGGLQTIADAFGGELDFRFTLDETKTKILNRYVDVKFSIGKDTGVRFSFDTNLTEVVRTVSSDNHFTVLYGLGRSIATGETKPDGSKEYKRVHFGDVTWSESAGNFANKPAGQRYIEDVEGIKKWGRIEGIYVNEAITDPGTLINRTWKQLQKCKEPSFSYAVTVEDLSKLAGYEHLNVSVGDTVIIKDEEFKLELTARIQEEQYSIKDNIIKALDAESTPPLTRAIGGLSSGGSGNKKLVLGVLQRDFTEDFGSSGTTSSPSSGSGDTNISVDNKDFPDILPAVPIISGTGLFSTIMTSWTFENSAYYGYELHGSQIENFIATKNTILARGDMSSHLHQCKPGERWYFKVRAYNTHGNYTKFSNEIMLESAKVADGTEWFESAAIGDALIGELRLDRGWVGKLTGHHIDARELSVTDGNGKRTLDIDSFGNVSLDVANLSINSSSVVTNDSLNSALGSYPTKTEMSSAITQTATEISSTVAKQEVQNMQIGGTNLIGQTTETRGYGAEVVEVTETGWTVRGSNTDRDNAVFRFRYALDGNGWYTFSFDGKFGGSGFRTYVEANDQRVGTVDLTSEWQHFSFTFEVTNYDFDNTGVYTFIEFQRLGNELYYFKNVKLEHGKIETDYSPCPRDYSTTTQMNSAIIQTATEISSTVAKEEVQNMEIGGRNLIKNTPNILLQDTDYSGNYNSCSLVDGANSVYVRIAPTVDGNVYGHLAPCEKLIKGEWYTISFEFWNDSGSPVGIYWYPSEHYEKRDYIPSIANKWQKVSFTYQQTGETRGGGSFNCLFGFHQLKAGIRYAYTNVQLERGKIATSWSPSPSDYSTTTQMNSAIQQKANEINLGVTQTINSIQTGGKNLIKNGNFEDGLNHWVYERFSGVTTTDLYVRDGNDDWAMDGKKQCSFNTHGINDDSQRKGEWTIRQYFKTVVGQEYTISYMIAGHRSYKTVAVRENKNWGYLGSKDYGHIEGGKNANSWVYDSITFTATTSDTMIWFIMRETMSGTNAHMWFTDVCCVEGNKAQRFIPSLEEYSTTAQMNSAIQLKADSITSTVNMSKICGVELLPQGYRRGNSTSGYSVRSGGTLNCNELGLYTTKPTFVVSDYIAVDPNLPIAYEYDITNSGGNPLTYLGVEQYTGTKEEVGSNAATIYFLEDYFTGNRKKSGTLTLNSNTRYIRFRWLSDWNSSGMSWCQLGGISLKQLGSINQSTQISQMSDSIKTKVDVNGVKSTIQQNPESVRIGFNAISNYFDLNSTRLQVGHSDGSYTQIGQNGIVYYDAHASWKYHSLMKQGWLGDISGTSWSRTITLPASFRNKTFSVIISIEMVNAVNTHDVIKHYKVTVPQNTVNYANGTFVINMSALAYWVPGQGSATAITTNVSWIAIA